MPVPSWPSRSSISDWDGKSAVTDPQQNLKAGRVLNAFLFRARIAEIHLLHLAVNDLRQKNGCVIAFTNVAQHLARLDLAFRKTFKWLLLSSTFRAGVLCRNDLNRLAFHSPVLADETGQLFVS